jgi:hypothetical protein
VRLKKDRDIEGSKNVGGVRVSPSSESHVFSERPFCQNLTFGTIVVPNSERPCVSVIDGGVSMSVHDQHVMLVTKCLVKGRHV